MSNDKNLKLSHKMTKYSKSKLNVIKSTIFKIFLKFVTINNENSSTDNFFP